MRKKVKRKKKHHLNRLKTRKAGSSWFISIFFLLIYFRFSTIIINFATKYQFKHTSNNLKRYINNLGA